MYTYIPHQYHILSSRTHKYKFTWGGRMCYNVVVQNLWYSCSRTGQHACFNVVVRKHTEQTDHLLTVATSSSVMALGSWSLVHSLLKSDCCQSIAMRLILDRPPHTPCPMCTTIFIYTYISGPIVCVYMHTRFVPSPTLG